MGLADHLRRIEGNQLQDSLVLSRSTDETSEKLQKFKRLVQVRLIDELGGTLYKSNVTHEQLSSHVYDVLLTILNENQEPLSAGDRAQIVQEVVDDSMGFGPIEPLLRDQSITEIMVNRFDSIYFERYGQIHKTDLTFYNERNLRDVIDRIVSKVGRRVDEASPMVDARLADGSRVNAVVPPIAVDGSSLTIRKFAKDILTVHDLLNHGTISQAAVDFLSAAVAGKQNIIISGGTGSGKTTSLNVLTSFIPEGERLVTIEDSAELRLNQQHVVRLEARPSNIEGIGEVTIRTLVKNALRMRPDRIIVGEVRDAAALDMLQAMNTGHEGSLSTVHANSAKDALSRLETMVLTGDLQLPSSVVREQLVTSIDVIVQMARLRDGKRYVTEISEVVAYKDGQIMLQEIFGFSYDTVGGGYLAATGVIPSCLREINERGFRPSLEIFKVI